MAEHPLDLAAKTLANTTSRRQVVKSVGALAVGAVMLAGARRATLAADSNDHQRQCHERCRRECGDRNTRHDRSACEQRCRDHC